MKLPFPFRRIRKSTLRTYFLYYLSVAVLVIVLVIISLFSVSVRTLNTSLLRTENEKLSLAAEDMHAQLEQIQNITYTIRSSVYYQPAYVLRNRYYEFTMVEDLQKYREYSPVMADYFLLYDGNRSILRPDGKTPFHLYAASGLGWPSGDVDSLYQTILSTDGSMTLELPGGDFLQIYSIDFYSSLTNSDSGRAWFCAVLSGSALEYRIELCSGGFESGYMLGLGPCELETVSSRQIGDFSLSLLHSPSTEYSEVRRFRELCTRLSVLFTVLLVLSASGLAYASWLPIRRVIVRHNMLRDHGSALTGDELTLLDDALTQAVQHRRLSEKQTDQLSRALNLQRRNLRETLLLALLNGECTGKTLSAMKSASLHLDGPWYAVFLMRWERPLAPEQEDAIIASIENLSGDDTHSYVFSLDTQPVLVMVASAADSESFSQMPDILTEIALMDVSEPPRISGSFPVTHLSRLPEALSSALFTITQPDTGTSPDRDLARPLLEAVEQGNCAAALAALDEFNDTLSQNGSFAPAQRYAYGDLINRIVILSRKQGISMTPERIEAISSQPASAAGQRELRLTIAEMCERTRTEKPLKPDDPRGERIVAYLRDHVLDYNVSLESVAEAFGLSQKQIGRILVRETGMNYKEILTDLRVQRAKDLLTQGESVNDVCEQLNYSSVSYFIKLFREKTGFTPARFRAIHAGKNDDDPAGDN